MNRLHLLHFTTVGIASLGSPPLKSFFFWPMKSFIMISTMVNNKLTDSYLFESFVNIDCVIKSSIRFHGNGCVSDILNYVNNTDVSLNKRCVSAVNSSTHLIGSTVDNEFFSSRASYSTNVPTSSLTWHTRLCHPYNFMFQKYYMLEILNMIIQLYMCVCFLSHRQKPQTSSFSHIY